jgi:hypothetical protein
MWYTNSISAAFNSSKLALKVSAIISIRKRRICSNLDAGLQALGDARRFVPCALPGAFPNDVVAVAVTTRGENSCRFSSLRLTSGGGLEALGVVIVAV